MSDAMTAMTSEWTGGEREVVRTAVQAAPSVRDTYPWVLEFHAGHGASLFERLDRTLPADDPRGRDRLISCGAALENLVLAMRTLGWDPDVELLADPACPDEMARVVSPRRRPPSDVELTRYAAITGRHSHRGPFTDVRVDPAVYDTLVAASNVSGVEVHAVRRERDIAALAPLLRHAALVLKTDRAHLRYRRSTALLDPGAVAARLRRECVLVVETPDDGPRDHIRAGMAVQSAWLAATAAGLAGSLLTQPLQVPEVRAGLIEDLELAGFPQALMRFGHSSKEESS